MAADKQNKSAPDLRQEPAETLALAHNLGRLFDTLEPPGGAHGRLLAKLDPPPRPAPSEQGLALDDETRGGSYRLG